MSANLGNIQAGPQWSDLGYAGDAGPTLSICLAEEVNSTCEWECRVLARTEHGSFHVGSFRTRPPARGEVPARLVAIAYFPGALGWLTSWRLRAGGNARSAAAASLHSSSDCPAGTLPGVTPMLSGVTAASPRVFTFNGAIGLAPVQLAPPGALLSSVVGQLTDPAGVAGFVMLFDSAAAPALGAIPIFSRHLGSTAPVFASDPTNYAYLAGAQGRPITLGLWAAFSSTADTFTPLAGNTFNATTEAGLP